MSATLQTFIFPFANISLVKMANRTYIMMSNIKWLS